eukprot:16426976-Heterocapsa_arctica.AAC.1
MQMINSALVTRERGRSPTRYNISDEDEDGPPRGTDDEVGGEGNPDGDCYDNYDNDLNQYLETGHGDRGLGGHDEAWWSSDPYGRWQPYAGGGNGVSILRYKEKDEIPVPSFPTGPGMVQWRMQVAKALANSSGHTDQAEINWFVSEGFGPGITFESLADSGAPRFKSIDMKLSAALGKVVKNANNPLSIDLATIEE